MQSSSRRCSFCDQTSASYSCPKCGRFYCSLACYNCEKHRNCSEAFYKKCVEDELRSKQPSDEARRRTLEIIKREYEQLAGDPTELDEDLDELREQLGGLHLANERTLWSKLTEEEKRNFEQLLKRNEIVNLLPVDCWTPWYLQVEPKRLIEPVGEGDQAEQVNRTQRTDQEDRKADECEETGFDVKKDQLIKEIEGKLKALNVQVPELPLPIRPLAELTKTKPSPQLKCALINVLFVYCFICRYFSNDHLSFPVESFKLLDELSLLTQRRAVFASTRQAIQFAIQLLINRQRCRTDFVLVLIDDLKFILDRPEKLYLNIIADLHRLTRLYRQRLKRRRSGVASRKKASPENESASEGDKNRSNAEKVSEPGSKAEDVKETRAEDSKKSSESGGESIVPSKETNDEQLKELGALLKKLEYYLSYANESRDDLVEQIAEIEMERLYLLDLKRSIDKNLEDGAKGEIKFR